MAIAIRVVQLEPQDLVIFLKAYSGGQAVIFNTTRPGLINTIFGVKTVALKSLLTLKMLIKVPLVD